MNERHYSLFDRLLAQLDQAVRTIAGSTPRAERLNPAANAPEAALAEDERLLAGRLMRINHAGEVAAQALYQSQALTARQPRLREAMQQAAREENDHLAWTEERIRELGTHTSYLGPFWYAGSFAIGTLAGLAGDRWNLGFVAETEHQVVRHLDDHLSRLPQHDARSRRILEQMRDDELHHATAAMEAGAHRLPEPVKLAMRLTSKIMTRAAYWI
jgi:ubiquinone biosynthesis monooxygenase Coq7